MIEFKKGIQSDEWNAFLEKESNNQMVTIAHNPSLGPILSKTFGYKEQNFFVVKNNKVVGAMPSINFKDKIVSIPHFSYGGPIWLNNESEDQHFQEALGENKFEIRSFNKLSENYYDKKVSCILNIKPTNEEQLKGLKSKLRQKIRKAEKQNFQVVHGGLELLDTYYEAYSRKMLKFGSPPIGKSFFKNLLTDYKYGEALITVMYDGDIVIAAAMSLSYMGFIEVCWSATKAAYNKHNIHALICWNICKYAINKEYSYFSFGRSTIDSNNHKFKRQWNPMEMKIYYNYSEPVGKSIREFDFLTKIWKLQPLKTSVFFGHMISKYIY